MIIFATRFNNIDGITFLSFWGVSSYSSLARLFCIEFQQTFLLKCLGHVEIT